jgi:hypothetical protein
MASSNTAGDKGTVEFGKIRTTCPAPPSLIDGKLHTEILRSMLEVSKLAAGAALIAAFQRSNSCDVGPAITAMRSPMIFLSLGCFTPIDEPRPAIPRSDSRQATR